MNGGKIVAGDGTARINLVWDNGVVGSLELVRTYPNGCTSATMININPSTIRAIPDFAAIDIGSSTTLSVLSNDVGSGLTLVSVSNPAGGSIVTSGNAVAYTPNTGFSGFDYFEYLLRNGDGCLSTGAIVISVLNSTNLPVNLEYVERHKDGSAGVNGLQKATAIAHSHDGRFVYAAGQYDNAIAIFSRDTVDGSLSYVGQVRNGSGGVQGLSLVADIVCSPDGAHLYAAGYGNNAIAVFRRNSANGTLTYQERITQGQNQGGNTVDGLQRVIGLAISPDGSHVYAAGYNGNTLAVFQRHSMSGSLEWLERHKDGSGGVNGLYRARSVAVSPDGTSVYAAGNKDNAIAVFSRNLSSGLLNYEQQIKDGVNGVDGLNRVYDVAVSPDSRNVYAVGYSDKALAVFARNTSTGLLTYLERHKDAVNGVDGLNGASALAVSNDGANVYAVGYSDNALALFERSPSTGRLAYLERMKDGVGGVDGLKYPRDVSVEPGSRHVYGAAFGENALSVFFRNLAPATEGEYAVLARNSSIEVFILENDSDVDGHALSISSVTDGALGTVSITGGGTTATYSAGSSTGSDSFTYTIADGHGGSSTATVDVNVTLSKMAVEEFFTPGDQSRVSETCEVWPNPSRGEVNFRIVLEQEAVISLHIVDGLGRERGAIHKGRMHGGTHVLHWFAEPQDYPAGQYFVKLEIRYADGRKKEQFVAIRIIR